MKFELILTGLLGVIYGYIFGYWRGRITRKPKISRDPSEDAARIDAELERIQENYITEQVLPIVMSRKPEKE